MKRRRRSPSPPAAGSGSRAEMVGQGGSASLAGPEGGGGGGGDGEARGGCKADERGKGPVAGGGGEEGWERAEEAEMKRGEGEGSSSSPFRAYREDDVVAVFCDACGDPKPASAICFDVVGCTHLFCFACLSLFAALEDGDGGGGGGDVVPCPVPGCRAGFVVDLAHGGAPTVGTEDEPEGTAAAEEALTYFCSICMERKPPEQCFLDLRGCEHVFCAECIAGYVAAKVEENVVAIGCPDPECTAGRLEPEACRPVIDAAVFQRWGAALCEAAVGEGSRFYCPYRDCSALLWVGEEEGMRDAQCGHCQRVCCAQCRVPWHTGMTCKEYRRKAEEGAEAAVVMEMAKVKQWQRCPKCGFLVDRVDGCVFIRCRCSHCFCYRCASPMDPKDKKHYCPKCQLTWDDKKAQAV